MLNTEQCLHTLSTSESRQLQRRSYYCSDVQAFAGKRLCFHLSNNIFLERRGRESIAELAVCAINTSRSVVHCVQTYRMIETERLKNKSISFHSCTVSSQIQTRPNCSPCSGFTLCRLSYFPEPPIHIGP